MKKHMLIGLAAAGALALSACSGTGGDKGASTASDLDLKYAVITHAPSGDAFWDRVKSGVDRAADDYGVKATYAGDPDPAEQAKLIDGAVADKVDGIVVSMANPDGLQASIKKAVAAGIPVVTINAGLEESQAFGAITHIGQSETVAGKAVGERLKSEGHKKVICVIQAAGAINLEQRCAAVKEALGGTVENLQVDGTDDNAVTSTITSKLQADKSIDGIVTLGGQQGIDAIQSVQQSGSKATIATFDLSEDVLNAIKDGKITFAVDQQPFIQGYLGITTLYLKSINGNDVGGGQPINSGPAFVDQDNADSVLKFAKNGTR